MGVSEVQEGKDGQAEFCCQTLRVEEKWVREEAEGESENHCQRSY